MYLKIQGEGQREQGGLGCIFASGSSLFYKDTYLVTLKSQINEYIRGHLLGNLPGAFLGGACGIFPQLARMEKWRRDVATLCVRGSLPFSPENEMNMDEKVDPTEVITVGRGRQYYRFL